MVRRVLVIVFALGTVVAHAQSPYVAGTIGADVSRVSHSTSTLTRPASGDSDVFSWSLRVGTPVGESWGVELEFVQSGRSRGEVPNRVSVLISDTLMPIGGLTGAALPNLPIPISGFQTDVKRSHSDLDTAAWARQRVSGSVELVYLGGLAFSRQWSEITQTFPTLRAPFAPGGGTFRTTTIDYATRPLVGAEARIGLTSHVRLVPGIRLQGLADGWLLRPYVGLGWFF